MILTKSQNKTLDEVNKFLSTDSDVFILNGAAGTGKTTLCKEITNQLDKSNKYEYILLAPTGRASRVIASKTNKDANTIHKHIYTQSKIIEFTKKKGSADLKTTFYIKENEQNQPTIYIIDESSMISNKYSDTKNLIYGSGYLLDDLIQHIFIKSDYKNKIIFVGDKAQLPPIRTNLSPALDSKELIEMYDLKVCTSNLYEIVRQNKNNELLKDAKFIREQIEKNNYTKFTLSSNSKNSKHVSYYDLENKFLESYNVENLTIQ